MLFQRSGKTNRFVRAKFFLGCVLLSSMIAACAVSSENDAYFGRVVPPSDDSLRYVSGPEPESLDPQIGTGQVEQRIYLALFEGLVEYDPQTLEPIPAIAERWETNADSTELTFYLRKNAKWSNGEPITAHDFVYTMRRGLDPKLASRGAGQAFYIKYAKDFNEGAVFAQDAQTGEFLDDAAASVPTRLTLPGSEKKRAALLEKNSKLAQEVVGKNFIPVAAEDLGVEAIDDYTVKISLTQSVPFFIKILPYNLFRIVPQKAIERFGKQWTQPENMVSSGAFKLKEWSPYDKIVVEKNPNYWDAAHVRLEQISFYPIEEQGTMMNLYKAGAIDATYNHSVPRGWLFSIEKKKDYQDALEAGIEYYIINTTKPPMNDVRVRRAFAMAIDKSLLTVLRRNAKPSSTLIPTNIFKDYPTAQTSGFDSQAAQKLLAEAGFRDAQGNYDASKFPIEEIAISYNTSEGNKFFAEIIQSQWKRNLNLTVPLKSVESKTFFAMTAKLEYKGFARYGYGADYIDPYSFLSLYAAGGGDNGTGWKSEKYDELLNKANLTLDSQQRLQLLADAESLLLSEQPIIPLTTASTNWLKKPYVKGMYPNALTLHPWKFVYIERDETKW